MINIWKTQPPWEELGRIWQLDHNIQIIYHNKKEENADKRDLIEMKVFKLIKGNVI